VIIPARPDDTGRMRFKRKIFEWNDARGFGFIAPAEGGARVFDHVKAFTDRSSRPELGETVTYELTKDDRGRPRSADPL
jgi:cold shock CspA family protein